MTEITDEGGKLAAVLANEAVRDFGLQSVEYTSLDLGRSQNAAFLALARLATNHLALKARLEATGAKATTAAELIGPAWQSMNGEEQQRVLDRLDQHEKAVADLREIDRQIKEYREKLHMDAGLVVLAVHPIAAKYRETDPLVEELRGLIDKHGVSMSDAGFSALLAWHKAELARVKP